MSKKDKMMKSLEKNLPEIKHNRPIKIDKDTLATKALAIMNEKKITSLCIYEKKNRFITIGILHIHNILNKEIY